jgi:ankyrin repeat protein
MSWANQWRFSSNIAMAELLLKHGARVDAAGPDGRTPLMFAVMMNAHRSLVRLGQLQQAAARKVD